MKDILKILLRLIMLIVVLFLVAKTFRRADQEGILTPEAAAYSKGNATDSIRNQIISQLYIFQEGYTERDTSKLDAFMESLYSRENVLILGTSPREIFRGYDEAAYLVRSDWESWGDCRFMIDSASISSAGDVAWFATRGYVEFDLSKLLVLPLRLTGVMVKEDHLWRFTQQQFQFDIDFSFSLLAILVLSVWILVSLVSLVKVSFRAVKARRSLPRDPGAVKKG
jgi:hypothetical protein